MKKILQIIAFVFLSSLIFGAASASTQPVFGARTKTALARPLSPDFMRVVVHNYTYDTYMVRSTYKPTNTVWDMYLGSAGSSTSSIIYDVSWPDYYICFDIYRDYDGLLVYSDCTSTGDDIYITDGYLHSAASTSKGNKPVIKVEKAK